MLCFRMYFVKVPSHSTWVRGLKYRASNPVSMEPWVALYVSAWINHNTHTKEASSRLLWTSFFFNNI